MNGVETTIVDQVEILYQAAAWEIRCTWPRKTRGGGINTIIKVRDLTEDPPKLVVSSTSVNLLSHGAKNQIAVAMRNQGTGDKKLPEELVHHVAEDVLRHFRQAGKPTRPQPRQRQGDSHLIYPIWPATGETLIGAGTNSFKSVLAEAIAVEATTGADILSGNTRPPKEPFPVLYCDWEANEQAFSERLYAILKGAGLPLEPCVAYLGKITTPLTDAAPGIADQVRRHGYQGVIIDSLSAAIGGSLIDDDLANQFWDAAATLGVPTLILAHKSAEAIRKNHQRAFGSVMHENRPRMYWDARREPSSPLVAWEIISDNLTGRQGDKLAWRIDLENTGEHQERRLDTIRIEAVNPNNVRQAPEEGATLPKRIENALLDLGPVMSGELAMALGLKDNSVRNQLSRHKTMFNKRPDGRWELTQ